MTDIKKLFSGLLFFSFVFLLCSCDIQNKAPGVKSLDVDFSSEKSVRCICDGYITNFNICNKNDSLALRVTNEEPSVLSETEIVFSNGDCTVTSRSVSFTRKITEYSSSFLPKIIYVFIYETDFLKTAPKYDKKSEAYTYSAVADGKFVQLIIEKNNAENGAEYLYTFKIV